MEELEKEEMSGNEESFPLRKKEHSFLIKRLLIAVLVILIVIMAIMGISKLVNVIKSQDADKKQKQALKTVKLEPFKYNLIDSVENIVANLSFELTLGYSGAKNDLFEKEVAERKEQIKDIVFFVVSKYKPRDLILMREIPESLFEKYALAKSREEHKRVLLEYYIKPRNKDFYRLREKIDDQEVRNLLDIFELTRLERDFFFKETIRMKVLEGINPILVNGKAEEIYIWKFNSMFN